MILSFVSPKMELVQRVNQPCKCDAKRSKLSLNNILRTVEQLFAAEPLLATMHWIIIAAGGKSHAVLFEC